MIKYLIAIILILGFLYYGNTVLQISKYTIHTDKLNGVSLKVMHLSDFHDYKYNERTLSKLLNGESPDIIVITGDLIDKRRFDLEHSLGFIDMLKGYPIYYVTGNHEAGSGQTELIVSELEKRDVTVLRNNVTKIGIENMTIQIIGLDDPTYQNEEVVTLDDDFSILLSHRLKLVTQYDADVSFSGHAHGGQIRLFGQGMVAPDQGFLPEYTKGIFKMGNTTSVMSRGLGNSIFRLRVFNRPEIVIVTIEDQNN
ncbi:MAG: metallophosphoesterase [Clostridiales bacterium]|nr:metallophosphoesterase [Clostridiales bacterium]